MRSNGNSSDQRPLLGEMFKSIPHFRFYALGQDHLVDEIIERERNLALYVVREFPTPKNIEEALLFVTEDQIVPLVAEFLEVRANNWHAMYDWLYAKEYEHYAKSIGYEGSSFQGFMAKHRRTSEDYRKEGDKCLTKWREFYDLFVALKSGLDVYLRELDDKKTTL